MANRKGPAVQLQPQEEKEMQDGMALFELTKSVGWDVINRWLNDRAYHIWADPREVNDPSEWQWRELNAFHASNNAKEMLEFIQTMVDRAEYLQKVKAGEITQGRMKI